MSDPRASAVQEERRPVAARTVALIGNPNCGKTTVFNLLTGAHQTVGNWPGVTVERKSGNLRADNIVLTLVDLPGVYSLSGGGAVDEAIARDYILSGQADLLLNIVDTSNLERQFGLTVEVLERGTPTVIVLNMMDEALRLGRDVDCERLSAAAGCPVLPFVATRAGERGRLVAQLCQAIRSPFKPAAPRYPEEIERRVNELSRLLGDGSSEQNHTRAARLIEGVLADPRSAHLAPTVQSMRRAIAADTGESAEDLIADARFGFAQRLVDSTIRERGAAKRTWSDRIDRLVLNRYLGVPIFFAIMYLLFVVSFSGGNIFLDFIDGMSHALFVSLPGWLLESAHAPIWIVQLVATATGGAIQLVLPFMAPVGLTFLFLTLLEESGYMARGTFVMDRFLRRLGLPGKTLVPMVVGFGCNVPAVMATRGIESPRDRLLVTMMQPFMSCSARLVIYMAFAAVFFRSYGGQVVFGLYVLGILMAVLTALLLGKTVLRGSPRPFVMDLPPYRVPTAQALALAVWQRLKIYLWRVGRVIASATVIIYLLSSFEVGLSGVSPTTDPGTSLLGTIGKAITPAFGPMGIQKDNWPATVGLLTGAVAKEVVIGTLNGAYSASEATTAPDYRDADVPGEMLSALSTIPANAAALARNITDPLGFGNLSDASHAATYSGASQATLRALAAHFTPLAAIAYLIFVLLYIPCVSTMGAVRRETGSWRWTIYAIVWGIAVAYGLATAWYQLAHLADHPAATAAWIGGIAVVFLATVYVMSRMGAHGEASVAGNAQTDAQAARPSGGHPCK